MAGSQWEALQLRSCVAVVAVMPSPPERWEDSSDAAENYLKAVEVSIFSMMYFGSSRKNRRLRRIAGQSKAGLEAVFPPQWRD